MEEQRKVAAFFEEYDVQGKPAYQALALAAEVGEIADDVTKSTDWGIEPAALHVERDEVGDALFCLLALAESLDVDASRALEESLAKYRTRIEDPETPYTGDRYETDLDPPIRPRDRPGPTDSATRPIWTDPTRPAPTRTDPTPGMIGTDPANRGGSFTGRAARGGRGGAPGGGRRGT